MNSQKHLSGNGHRPTFDLLTQPFAAGLRKHDPFSRDHDISSHAKKHHTVQHKTGGARHEHLLVVKYNCCEFPTSYHLQTCNPTCAKYQPPKEYLCVQNNARSSLDDVVLCDPTPISGDAICVCVKRFGAARFQFTYKMVRGE